MKVILLQELKGKGGEGDVVEVARGFAVNYLFRNNIAIEATKGNLKQLEMRKHNIEKREAERMDNSEKTKAVLDGMSLDIVMKVGEEGQLFGSVTPQLIVDAIKEQHDITIDKRKIDIHGNIKTAGEHEATVSIYREVKATLKLHVGDKTTAEEEAEAAAEEAVAAEAAEGEETVEVTDEVVENAEGEVVAEVVEEVVTEDTAAE